MSFDVDLSPVLSLPAAMENGSAEYIFSTVPYQRHSFFQQLPPESHRLFLSRMTVKRYPAETIISTAGDEINSLSFVLEGSLGVFITSSGECNISRNNDFEQAHWFRKDGLRDFGEEEEMARSSIERSAELKLFACLSKFDSVDITGFFRPNQRRTTTIACLNDVRLAILTRDAYMEGIDEYAAVFNPHNIQQRIYKTWCQSQVVAVPKKLTQFVETISVVNSSYSGPVTTLADLPRDPRLAISIPPQSEQLNHLGQFMEAFDQLNNYRLELRSSLGRRLLSPGNVEVESDACNLTEPLSCPNPEISRIKRIPLGENTDYKSFLVRIMQRHKMFHTAPTALLQQVVVGMI